MEGIAEKVRIIEFNGLPGSGKTTIARVLQTLIEQKNEKSVRFEYHRLGIYRNPYSLVLSPSYYQFIHETTGLSKAFAIRPKFISFLMPYYYLRMYHHFLSDNKSEILIVDEGIIQMFISLAFQNIIPKTSIMEKIISHIEFDKLPIVSINCHCDINKTAERIKNRPSNGCRLERLDKTNLDKSLHIQENNFSYLRSIIVSKCPSIYTIDVNTDKSPSYNADYIYDLLASML